MFRSTLRHTAYSIAAALAVFSTLADAMGRSASADASATQGAGRERTVYVSVLNDKDEPVTDLKPEEFVIREGKARREVLRVSKAIEPIAVAMLVDNSAAAESDIPNIRDGVELFTAQMREHDVAIIGLADRPTILQDYTKNAELLKKAVGRLFAQPGSGMMFLEGVIDVSRGLARRDESRAAIVAVLTDGAEFSNQHYNQVLDSLARGGAAMYAFPIGTFRAPSDDERRNRSVVLDEGPRRSGGDRHELLSSMALEDALARLARELSNQYKVVYGRPESLIDPGPVTVDVTRAGLTARGTPERRKPGA